MKSLFTIEELSSDQIVALLDRAESYIDKRTNELANVTVATLFMEPSTRTRLSFELAAHRLGAEVVSFVPETSSVSKGESLKDTALTVAALGVDLIVVRHRHAGSPELVGRWTKLPVVNGGDGRRSHPTQTLLDLLTMRQIFGRIDGLAVGIVGDVANSRVARGLVDALPRMGAGVTLVGPSTFTELAPPGSVQVSHGIDEVITNLDVVYLLRVQKERGAAGGYPTDASYHHRYGIDSARQDLMKPGAVVMHPGPINRGVEIASEVADGDRSALLHQVRNGVPVRMAVMASLWEERS